MSSSSIDALNAPSGTYTLNVFDANNATYSFDFDLLSPDIMNFTASIDYSSSLSSSIKITNLAGGLEPYNVTASPLESFDIISLISFPIIRLHFNHT